MHIKLIDIIIPTIEKIPDQLINLSKISTNKL